MPDPKTINELVNEALRRWVALTGLVMDDDGLNVKSCAGNCPWQSWTVRQHTEELNKSRELDPTGLTTFMLLRGLTESYLQQIQYDAHTLILDPSSIETQLVPMRALRDVLEAPDVVELIAGFQKQLYDAGAHYGVRAGDPTKKLGELLEDKYSLAHIRRDALLSLSRLEAHQFTQGDKDPNPLKYNPQVFEFWNVNSLLAGMRAQKVPGISLCLIRDPVEALHSYFVFAIRNGGTLTVLTDRTKGAHPAYKRMSRRPDRMLDRRASQNWFPYQLLELEKIKDAEGDVKGFYARARKQLVPINIEAIPLKDIRDLEPEQFVWTILVFDLIRDKFWKQDAKLPELSYTGQMVTEPAALVGATGSLVLHGHYKPLELPALVKEDVMSETTKAQWERDPTNFNAWLTKRYGAEVPDEVLSPVGESAKLLLEAKTEDSDFLPVRIEESFGKTKIVRVEFETFDPTSFGTKDDIQKDRLWVGRMNQMKAIQRLADVEFEREKDGIIAWFMERLKQNQEFLFNACVRGELLLPTWRAARMTGVGATTDEEREEGTSHVKTANVIDQRTGSRWSSAHDYYSFHLPKFRLGEYHEESTGPSWRVKTRRWVACAEKPELRASVFTRISPSCPEALAVLVGMDVEELPWPLRYWYDDEPYHGNSILDRLDPEDWVLNNPWMPTNRGGGIRFDLGIAHSKIAYQARRKALGLPRKQWESKDKDTDE